MVYDGFARSNTWAPKPLPFAAARRFFARMPANARSDRKWHAGTSDRGNKMGPTAGRTATVGSGAVGVTPKSRRTPKKMTRRRFCGTPKSLAYSLHTTHSYSPANSANTSSSTDSPAAVFAERMPMTFSIKNAFGLKWRMCLTNSMNSEFLGSFGSRRPAMLNPWQGGPPTTTSTVRPESRASSCSGPNAVKSSHSAKWSWFRR